MRKLIAILIVLAGCGTDALPPCPDKPCPCTRAGVCTCDGATCQRDLGNFNRPDAHGDAP